MSAKKPEITKMRVGAGDEISSTIKEAIAGAKRMNGVVEFEFNGVFVRVNEASEPDLVYRDWDRALRGCTDKTVGPDYKRELSTAEKQHDAAVRAANDARQQERQREWRRQNDVRRAKVDALIDGVSIELANSTDWEKTRLANQDGYGAAAFRYGERFGRVIQAELAKGSTVADAANKWEFEVDDDGLTGFQQSCALVALFHCWKHGPALKVWYVAKYGR